MSRSLRDFLVSELPQFEKPEDLGYSITVDWVPGSIMVMLFEIGVFDRGMSERADRVAEHIVSTLEQDLIAMGRQSNVARVRIASARMIREFLVTVSADNVLESWETVALAPAPTTRSALLDVPVPARRFSFDED